MMNGKVRDGHRVAGSKHVLVPCDVTIVQHQILAVPHKDRTSLFSTLRIRRAMVVHVTIVHTLRDRGGQSVTRGAKHELIRRQQIKNVDPRVRQRNGTQPHLPWTLREP